MIEIMHKIRQIFRAIFVLPFSAGNPKPRHNEDQEVISHDGSISGLVFLVCVMIILSLVLLISSTGQNFDHIHTHMFIITMTVMACLAMVICIGITVYAKTHPDVVMPSQHWDISGKIMLIFLWFFTLASVFDSVIYLIYHMVCFTHSYERSQINGRITCDSLLLLFRVIQTGFVTYYCKTRFASRLCLYYGLLILFLTNILVIVIDFAHEIRYFHDYTLNITGNATFPSVCETNSSVLHVLDKIEEYLEPAVFEYSLLSLLFISELWPKSIKTSNLSRQLSYVYDSFSERASLLHNDENVYDNLTVGYVPNKFRHRIIKYCCVMIACVISIPGLIRFAVEVLSIGSHKIDLVADCLNSIEISVMVLVTIICFYRLQTDCRPQENFSHFGSKEYLILASLVGSLAYYTMRLVAYVYLLDLNTDNSNKIFNYVMRILEIYLQTVFIYQMKDYEKKGGHQLSFTSIEFGCLFMAVTNLINWAGDSFLASQFVFANDAPTMFYGKRIWTNSYSILYPFAIFYRFKCFVAFYGLYDRLKEN